MNPFEIIDDIIDWLLYWRFNLCFFGGLGIGVLCIVATPEGNWQWVAFGFWAISGLVTGLMWESKSG